MCLHNCWYMNIINKTIIDICCTKDIDIDPNLNIMEIIKTSAEQGVQSFVLNKLENNYLLDSRSKAMISVVKRNNISIKKKIIRELNTISCLLKKNGLKTVILKGEALNEIAYDGLRDYRDIDLLISQVHVERFIEIMENAGYNIIWGNNIISREKAMAIFSLSCDRCFAMSKEINGYLLVVDIHKKNTDSMEPLDYIFNNAVSSKKYDGLYITDVISSFIYACIHMWHHYPSPYIIGSLNGCFKCVLDIKEIWRVIQENSLTQKVYSIICSLQLENLVKEMVYVATRVISDFKCNLLTDDYKSLVVHDFNNGEYDTIIENRIMEPLIERQKYYDYKRKCTSTVLTLPESSYSQAHVLEEVFDTSIEYKIVGNQYCHEEFGYRLANAETLLIKYYLSWNQNRFYIKVKVDGSVNNFSSIQGYDPYHDLILLCFNDDWNDKISIQFKTNGNHMIYMDRNDLLEVQLIEDAELLVHKYNTGYELMVGIPWDYMDISPSKGSVIDFFILVHKGQVRELGALAYTSTNLQRKLLLK